MPIAFEKLGNALQNPEFKEVEIEENIANFEDSTKRESIGSFGVSLGTSNFSDKNYFDMRSSYIWDIKTFWIEASLNSRIGSHTLHTGMGVSILYPFSDKRNTFYIGSGGGFAISQSSNYNDDNDDNGLFVENSFGYLAWFSKRHIRIEAFAGAIFYDEKSIGGGLRVTFDIFSSIKKQSQETLNLQMEQEQATAPPPKEQVKIIAENIEEDSVENNSQKKETKFAFRFAYNLYNISGGPNGKEFGPDIKAGIVGNVPIGNISSFVSGPSFFIRTLTLNNVMHYDDGYNYYNDFKLEEVGVSIPALFRVIPFGGPRFYVEGGIQLDFILETYDKEHVGYDSRSSIDFGLAYGIGWNIGKKFSFGFRGVSGLNKFDSDGRDRPFQFELGVSMGFGS